METVMRDLVGRRRLLRALALAGLGVMLSACGGGRGARSEYNRADATQPRCSVCGAPAVFYCPVRKAWFCAQHASRTSTRTGYRYICPR
jgi:hypothetical protein